MMNDEPLPVIAPAHVKYLGAKAPLFVLFILIPELKHGAMNLQYELSAM